jgi:low affinity Fe/Cu permease
MFGKDINTIFSTIARKSSDIAGGPYAFLCAVLLIIIWLALGPYYGWSDFHQLLINTTTTIITFLMVFLIQNAQSRDTLAIHLKLDELIRVNELARNMIIGLQDLDPKVLQHLKKEFDSVAENDS